MRSWVVLAGVCLAVVNAAAAREWITRHVAHESPGASPAPPPPAPLRKDPRGDAPPPEVRALELSPDGGRLACLTAEGLALLITRTGTMEKAIELDVEGYGPHQVAFPPDGKWVAVASRPGEEQLVDVASGATRARLAAGSPGLARRRRSFAIQPGGGLVATSRLGVTVRLRDAKIGTEATPLPGHRHLVDQLAFAPGAGLVATAGPDGTVGLWNAATAEERQVMAAGAAPAAGLAHLLCHRGDVLRVAFSPDSRVLASASTDGTVVIWDAQRFRQLIK